MFFKSKEKNNEIFFRYSPKKIIKKQEKKTAKESPFGILKNLDIN